VLSDDERRMLDDIERDLVQDEVFAGRFTVGVRTRRWLFLGDVLGLTGLTLILTGLFVAEATGSRFVICIAGFLLVVAAVILQLGDHHP